MAAGHSFIRGPPAAGRSTLMQDTEPQTPPHVQLADCMAATAISVLMCV